MRANFGEHFKLTIFGESHGPAIGIVIDGVPSGMVIDEEAIARHMARRAPGSDPTATARKEADKVKILSGVFEGRATGAPLCAMIENTNTRSGDYAALRAKMRPGHADYAGQIKYGGYNDPRGGGHFSGRLTAPLVFAGSVARALLEEQGVTIGAHIASIAGHADKAFDPVHVGADTLRALHESRFPLLDPAQEAPMRALVAQARAALDSVGGVTPSGWRTSSLPYLIELDNAGGFEENEWLDAPCWPKQTEWYKGGWWGYDEIGWFAIQPGDYRRKWLRYAWHWIKNIDGFGYCQMPGHRPAVGYAGPNGELCNEVQYLAHRVGDVETMAQIWLEDHAEWERSRKQGAEK